MAARSIPIKPRGSANNIAFDYAAPKEDGGNIDFYTERVAGTLFARFSPATLAFCVDVLSELTSAAGVTIDGLQLKDAAIQAANNSYFLKGRNQADDAYVNILKLNASNLIELGTTVSALALNTPLPIASGGTGSATAFSWTDYTPTLSASGSMTYTSTTINVAKHLKIGNIGFIKFNITGTTGGTASTDLRFSLPAGWSWADTVDEQPRCTIQDDTEYIGKALPSSGVVVIRKPNAANYTLGASRSYDGTVIARLA